MRVRALFVDAAGTLLRPREPVGVTYARAARQHGIEADPVAVEARFRAALRDRREERQRGDGRAYWSAVVRESVGHDHPELFEELYRWYTRRRAWWIDVEALAALGQVARSGVRLGIVSNWDRRLRTLYNAFALDRMFPVLICSAEHGVEKPDPWIFRLACRAAGVSPREAVHIGDDPDRDVAGASSAGLSAMLYDDDFAWVTLPERIRSLRRVPWR